MSYLNDFKRMAMGRELPSLTEAKSRMKLKWEDAPEWTTDEVALEKAETPQYVIVAYELPNGKSEYQVYRNRDNFHPVTPKGLKRGLVYGGPFSSFEVAKQDAEEYMARALK